MDTRRVALGSIELVVAEAGRGGRPFLLLHGFTGAKEDFSEHEGWLDRLAGEGFHAVAPDHRGHGESDKPGDEGEYSFEILAADALALVDELGWDRFALLGHSMGGMVAQHLALRAPDRVTALVLMDTSHGPVEGIDRGEADVAVSIARERGMVHLAGLLSGRESPLTTPAAARLERERPGWREFGDRKLGASSPAMYAAMIDAILAGDDRLDPLASLPMPTLVVVGEQDTPFLAPSERMAKTIPDARLVVVPDAGHSPQFEAPAAWWEAITSFLAEVGDAR